MSVRTGSTRCHKIMPNKVGSDRPARKIDGFMHSVFAESLTLFQVNAMATQIHTIHYYNTDSNVLR